MPGWNGRLWARGLTAALTVTLGMVLPFGSDGVAAATDITPENPLPDAARAFAPLADAQPPDGRGSRVGQLATTERLCTPARQGNTVQPANIRWEWVWLPRDDGTGKRRLPDEQVCPCIWQLRRTHVVYRIDGELLDCER